MANAPKTFTQEQIDKAISAMNTAVDLRPQKITTQGAMEKLKDQILKLATEKGYTAKDVRTLLDNAGVTVPIRAISDVISKRKSRGKSPRKSAAPEANQQHQESDS